MASAISSQQFQDYFDDELVTAPAITTPPVTTTTTAAQNTTTTTEGSTTSTERTTTTETTSGTTISTTESTTFAELTITTGRTTTPTTGTTSGTTTSTKSATFDDHQFNIRLEPSLFSLLQEITNTAFQKMEGKIDHLVDFLTKKETTTTPTTTITTTTTTATTTAKSEVEERFFDDVFTEFDESIKEINMEKKVKKEQAEKKNVETLLIISLSSAGFGVTVLLMVTLFICLRKKQRGGKNQEAGEGAEHIYDELRPADPPLAQPEEDGVPFIDEANEESKGNTEEKVNVFKIKSGFIRKTMESSM